MPGCFTHEGGVTITKGQLFLWELIMTFVLVSTVYAVAVTKPGHGNIGPLAVGFSLFASAFIGEHHQTIVCRSPTSNSTFVNYSAMRPCAASAVRHKHSMSLCRHC